MWQKSANVWYQRGTLRCGGDRGSERSDTDTHAIARLRPHLSLAHIPSSHRLNEWHFTLPLAGGQDYRAFGQKNCPIAEPIRRDAVVNAFRLGQGEGLLTEAYVDSLARLPFGVLAGFLVGSIDLVFSIERSDGQPLYFLADYKSNRLDLRRERVHPISHFHPTWMAHEMRHHHYVVQAHLYALALHRFLRLRLGENYSYETQFGGAAYLFLRGMIGPDTPQSDDGRTYGVYFEKPNLPSLTPLMRSSNSRPRPYNES